MIPYGHQQITQEDINAVVTVLRSEYLTQGPAVPAFEQALCDYTGATHAVAVNSGTSALHIACLALGLGEGDWLWTTPISFVASANCGRYCGASIDFVDIDSQTWNLSVDALEQKLVRAEAEQRLPKVVVAVHLCGLPCEMEQLAVLAQRYHFALIEDACHAAGGRYQDQPVGAGRYSDITVFSFHPVKNMTTGEGGAALTNDYELAQRMRRLRSHGITSCGEEMTQTPDGPWYYQQLELGFNYRMTDLQAALGVSQLKRLDSFIEKRNQLAVRYDEAFASLPLQRPMRTRKACSAFHLYVVCLQGTWVERRREILEKLRASGVIAHVHFIPIHTQPYYRGLGFEMGDFPQAEKYYSEALTLPIYPELSQKDQQKVITTLQELLS